MVQAEGSHLWRPLKEVLIEQQVAARTAARRQAEKPKAPPPPDDLDDGPPIGIGAPADDGPPIGGIGETADDGPPIGIGEPAGIQSLADEPGAPTTDAAGGPPAPGDDLPAIPLKPLDGAAELHFPPEVPAESPVEAPAVDENPILEVLGDAPEAAPPEPTVPETETPVDSSAVDENPILQVLGDEPGASGPEPSGSELAVLDEMPVIPFKPVEDQRPGTADRSLRSDPGGEPERAPAPVDEAPLAAPWQQEDLPPAPPPPPPEAPAGPQVLADDVVAPPPPPPVEASAPDDRPPAISLASVDDETETLPPTPGPDDGAQPGGLGAAVLGPVAALGAFFSRFLEPINRLERGESLRESGAPPSPSTPTTPTLQKIRGTVSSWVGALGERVARLTRREEPVTPVPPVELTPLPIEPGTPSADPAPLPIEPLASAVEPEAAPAEPEPALPGPEAVPVDAEPAPFEPTPPSEPPVALRPAPREVFKPPPPMSALPSVPLADRHEPREVGDMYEGDDGESVLPILWHWTKRIVLLAVLVGGGAFVALNWKTWIPAAAEIGNRTFTEIDKYARSGERREQQDRILQEIGPQLSQLAPETIRLILSRSPTGVLDAAEVFWIATEAADRGLSSLTPEEAQELEALRGDLIDGLTPSERGRVREYESTRANREPFPVENSSALALYARGARVLPPEKRERLQALLGKAIEAGLVPPAGDETR